MCPESSSGLNYLLRRKKFEKPFPATAAWCLCFSKIIMTLATQATSEHIKFNSFYQVMFKNKVHLKVKKFRTLH